MQGISIGRIIWGVIVMSATAAVAQAEVQGPRSFGKTTDGVNSELYVLKNSRGAIATVTNYGATLVDLQVPDKNGKLADVVLGFDSVTGYESDANQYFGCTTGRVANRIAGGKFTLDGKVYQLAVNNGPNHLHGGVERSLSKVLWKAAAAPSDAGPAVRFTYSSPDGEEGYPGKLDITVTYTLTDKNELRIEYAAATDKPTPVNLTNHSYFNLSGAGSDTVLDHELMIDAETYTPTDETQIPTGKFASVAGTPLDLRKPTRLGAVIEPLIKTEAFGFDHNYVLKHTPGKVSQIARLRDPKSGRVMTVFTDQPGVQLYTGNHLKGAKGKGGQTYKQRSAVCLETQVFPDSVNHPNFPSSILKPGETYRHVCVYEFSAE